MPDVASNIGVYRWSSLASIRACEYGSICPRQFGSIPVPVADLLNEAQMYHFDNDTSHRVCNPYNPVMLGDIYRWQTLTFRFAGTSHPCRTCRTLSNRDRTKSPRSSVVDDLVIMSASYPKVQIRAFVPWSPSFRRGGRWSRNHTTSGPSLGVCCHVFVAPPFKPWMRIRLFPRV